jgi:hypothetical protein
MDLKKKLKALWKKYQGDNYGGNENEYFIKWRRKKIRSIFWRANLSIILAISLAALTIIREIIDLVGIHIIKSSPWLYGLWWIFLLFLIGAVVFAALWEFGENKLEVSEQELRFAVGMRNMLSDIEKFKQELAKIDNSKTEDEQITEVIKTLNKYLDRFINLSSSILCGNNTVHGGIMFHDPENETLSLVNKTKYSGYQPLIINLKETPLEQQGPAQKSFEKGLLGHMPKKSIKIGWLYRQGEADEYDFEEFIKGWFEIPPYDSELFESVISIPITSFAKEGQIAAHGVLNFTTDENDHFIPRDYVMAFCFASIIAQAKDLARMKANRILGEDA